MKKAKKSIIIVLILAAVAGLYLNRAYARVYSKFDTLKQPEVINMTVEKKVHDLKYAALGDSLTYGVGAENTTQSWPAIIAGKMTDNQTSVELTNLAVPGAKSQDVVDGQLPQAIKLQPDLITILIGTNDLHNFISLDTYRKNLSFILSELKSKTKAKIILINLPYLGTDSLLLPPYNYYFDQKTDKYNKVLDEVAVTFGLTPVDIHSTKQLFLSDNSYFAADDFHPSAKGYAIWANLIYESIQ
jgi:lysophospholipase L1-like esterase